MEAAPRFIPFRPPELVGREGDLERVHEALLNGSAAITPAITGQGGIGKTQLAVAYAYDSRAEVYKDGIFWLNAAEPIVPQMADYATRLGEEPPGAIADRGEYQRQLALKWDAYVRRHTNALVIADNVIHPQFLSKAVPGLSNVSLGSLPCRLLITSRESQLDGCRALPLDVLAEADAARLLASEAGLPPGSEADPSVEEIGGRLGGLPLALRIAGSLIRAAGMTPAAFAVLLRERGAVGLLDEGGQIAPPDYEKSLAVVLRESWDAIPEDQPLAKEAMFVLAVLPEARLIGTWLLRLMLDKPEDPKALNRSLKAGPRHRGPAEPDGAP